MPRIDPVQLLNCLSILLSPNGGVKSRDEVQRIANLMTKFSKKLVSKCIYIQILKCTETELLGLFMGSGGWRLVHMWLTESIVAKNWPLVRELLELLLLCPVDIDRLKTNNCPKLVKELSKDGNHFAIRALASKLVEQWLKTVKGENVTLIKISDIPQIINDTTPDEKIDDVKFLTTCLDVENSEKNNELPNAFIKQDSVVKEGKVNEMVPESDTTNDESTKDESDKGPEILPVLKISLKDGKQVVSELDESETNTLEQQTSFEKEKSKSSTSSKDKSTSKSSSKYKSDSSHKHRSSSHKRDSPTRSSRDKSKDKSRHSSHNSKSSKHSDSSRKVSDKSSSSSNKSKDDKSSRSPKDESRSKGSKHKERNKIEKGQQDKSQKDNANNSKETFEKIQTPSIHKLGKIPKLNDTKKEAPSISIEVRKPDEPKPKTVKTFNSKFRKHGLEEEIKPPPSRASLLSKKAPPIVPPNISIPKRPSPVHNEPPPEKKAKTTEPMEKPGAIKLIPAKPKPMLLLESDMFMDALNASATNKKEPKKRKRRTSGSKDGNGPNDSSPPVTPPASASSPNSEKKSAPLRFYQDTLDSEEDKEKSSDKNEENNKSPIREEDNDIEEKTDVSEKDRPKVNGLRGVLSYHKRKGPKKSIRWKPDSELEDIQYFELDETERVNVTKPFTDMKHLERRNEREAFQKARNLPNDDVMEEKTNWRPLILMDSDGQIPVEHGKNSKERDIQALRQKGTLQPLYFHRAMIPDTPAEPDPETHPYLEPSIIPLEDVAGNQDNISDFRNMPWPEPKGNAPPLTATNISMPTMFTPAQFPNSFPNPQFAVPAFQGPPNMPTEWQNGMPPPHIMNQNNMAPGPMGPSPMAPTAMPPNMPHGIMMNPENMMMDMFNGPNQMFPPVPPENFSMGPNMFPPNMNMAGPVMPGPEVMPGPGFRGAMRGRGAAGHWRNKGGPGGWEGPQRGRGGLARGSRKAICIYFQRKGSCRQGDNCTFLHPGVNCPY